MSGGDHQVYFILTIHNNPKPMLIISEKIHLQILLALAFLYYWDSKEKCMKLKLTAKTVFVMWEEGNIKWDTSPRISFFFFFNRGNFLNIFLP
jgi:hypothetical protein